MYTQFEHSQFLRNTLMVGSLFLSMTTIGNAIGAEVTYPDGALTWFFTDAPKSYPDAEKICVNRNNNKKITPENTQWSLPTIYQLAGLYQKSQYPLSETSRVIDKVNKKFFWIGGNALFYVNPDYYKTEPGEARGGKGYVACVNHPKSDNDWKKFEWSAMADEGYTFSEAEKKCSEMNKADEHNLWQLPPKELLQGFYKYRNVEFRYPLDHDNRLSMSGFAWSSTLVPAGSSSAGEHLIVGLNKYDSSPAEKEKLNKAMNANTSSGDTTRNKVMCLRSAEPLKPGDFDANGNYFDGTRLWSKITPQSIVRDPDIQRYCASLGMGWKYDIDENTLISITRTIFENRDEFTKHGWDSVFKCCSTGPRDRRTYLMDSGPPPLIVQICVH